VSPGSTVVSLFECGLLQHEQLLLSALSSVRTSSFRKSPHDTRSTADARNPNSDDACAESRGVLLARGNAEFLVALVAATENDAGAVGAAKSKVAAVEWAPDTGQDCNELRIEFKGTRSLSDSTTLPSPSVKSGTHNGAVNTYRQVIFKE